MPLYQNMQLFELINRKSTKKIKSRKKGSENGRKGKR